MRATITEMATDSFRASVVDGTISFHADGPTAVEAESALRARLREQIRLGDAAQRILYLLIDSTTPRRDPSPSNDGA